MKFKVTKEALSEGLSRVQGLILARTTIPVLSNVLMVAEKGSLRLTTSDMDLTSETSIPAEVTKAGSTTLPLKRLVAIVRECVAGELEFALDNQTATISAGSAVLKINGISAEDFPARPKFGESRVYTMKQEDLRRMLQRTAYSASVDATRGAINGVLLAFQGQKLTVVATDGRRLALVDSELEFPKECEGQIVLPPRAVSELSRTLTGEGPLTIRATANQVAFETSEYTLMSKLMEGVFPNFRQVIPSQCENRVVMPREDFLGALRRVSALAMDNEISLTLTFARNKLEVFGSVAEVGEAKESLPVKYDGKSIKIAFNPYYLIEPIKQLSSDNLYFEFNDDIGPGVLKSDESFLYVIMPVRVS